jgi:hypothetical protein
VTYNEFFIWGFKMDRLTPVDLEKLLGVCPLPGSAQELEVLAHWIEDILSKKGEKYIKQNRRKLIRDWSSILDYGLSKI